MDKTQREEIVERLANELYDTIQDELSDLLNNEEAICRAADMGDLVKIHNDITTRLAVFLEGGE